MIASSLPSLLTMQQVAEYLTVHIRTVRRLIKRGELVAHRINTTVRVDAKSVTTLLASSSNVSERAVELHTMRTEIPTKSGEEQPRLLRQLPKSKVWIGWVNFREIPLGTTDQGEAQRRLLNIAKERQYAVQRPAQQHETTEKRRPYRVYPEGGRFVVKYYDEAGRRRKHWIPNTAIPPVTTEAEAEALSLIHI